MEYSDTTEQEDKNTLKKNKKGQLSAIQGGFYALMFMAVAVVLVVILNSFGAKFVSDKKDGFCTGSLDDGSCYACTNGSTFTLNTTGTNCYKTTNASVTGTRFESLSAPWNISTAGLSAQKTLADSTGDVTDVGGISIILTLLVGVIGVFGYNRMKQ